MESKHKEERYDLSTYRTFKIKSDGMIITPSRIFLLFMITFLCSLIYFTLMQPFNVDAPYDNLKVKDEKGCNYEIKHVKNGWYMVEPITIHLKDSTFK